MWIVNSINMAQINHQLSTSLQIKPNALYKNTISILLRIGFLIHISILPHNPYLNTKLKKDFNLFSLSLRYWEGKPVVYLHETPMVVFKITTLRRRLKQGGGGPLLIWADGRLRTGYECLKLNMGGRLAGVISG
jgi:hypothetical protein